VPRRGWFAGPMPEQFDERASREKRVSKACEGGNRNRGSRRTLAPWMTAMQSNRKLMMLFNDDDGLKL
jgi:hypothetical protein